jgi:DNA polymerase-3 subunit delta'
MVCHARAPAAGRGWDADLAWPVSDILPPAAGAGKRKVQAHLLWHEALVIGDNEAGNGRRPGPSKGGLALGWQRVRGHEGQIEGFRRALARGRLAHAYLFAGPAGIGKRRFAQELARALLCEDPPADRWDACDHCPACVQVGAGTHPDFLAAGRPPESQEFPIDLMREVCQSFTLKPARGRGKVVLIDDADDLNEEAANCFLKTLEEPPPRSVLILMGTSPERQLSTILSRCQVIRFAPLPAALVDALLAEQGITDPAQRSRLARLAAGSPGQALELADPALWQLRQAWLHGLTQTPLDIVGLVQQGQEYVEAAGKEGAVQRQRARLALRLLVVLLNDALALGLGGTARSSDPEDRPALEKLAGRAGTEALLALLERCLEADRQIERNVGVVLVLESLVDAMAQKLAAGAA